MTEQPDRGEVVDALAQLSWRVQSVIGEAAASEGLSLSQLRLIGILRDREPEMLELAQHLGLDKSSVSGLVARAEARGLVERRPLPSDGRRVAVRLTDAGRALAARVTSEVDRRMTPLLATIPAAQQRGLVSLMGSAIPTLPTP
jgi:MarR family transcriptional regulator, lower aerobic nicotinate degradation pathway regulator